jgi:hypothetical protein
MVALGPQKMPNAECSVIRYIARQEKGRELKDDRST